MKNVNNICFFITKLVVSHCESIDLQKMSLSEYKNMV